MPNWCENRWTIRNATPELFQQLTREDGTFTFNKVRPMPEILSRINVGATKIDGQRVERWFEDDDVKRLPTPEETREIEATGYSDWYEWAVANWGTKWDSCNGETMLHGDTIIAEFDTAWNPPTEFKRFLETEHGVEVEDWYRVEGE